MKSLGILVLIAAALGYWVHDTRSKKTAEAGGRQVTAAGVWQTYAPQIGQASSSRKARVTGLRVITPAAEFGNQVANATLDQFIRRVEDSAGEVLAKQKQGTVRIHFTTGLKYQNVQVQAQGIDGPTMQALHARLMAMERLRVKSADVAFELQLAVSP